jgi:hypothetical protein
MSNDQTYRKARRTVEAKLGFLIHLSVYVIVNILLVAINLMTFPRYLWFVWALLGWGVGLFCHGFAVFVLGEGSSIKQRLIEKEMRKQESHDE